jgi:MFS family permease
MLDEDGPPRSRRQLLWTPIGVLAIGKVLSTVAVWTTNIAGAILVFELTGSAVMVGMVSVAQFTPQLLLAPWSGARADRSDRFAQVVAGTAILWLGSLLLTAWGALSGFEDGRDALVVIAAAGLVGTGFAVNGPATSALLPALVRRSELADALSLSTLPIVVARSVGPAFGAGLYLAFGPTITFGFAAALHLCFLVVLTQLRRRVMLAPRATSDTAGRRLLAGLDYLRSSPRTALLIAGVAVIGVGADPITTLTPPLAAELGADPGFVGTLASVFGIGAAVGFVVLSRARLSFGITRLGSIGLAMMGVGTGMAALAPSPEVAVSGVLLGGAGMTFALNAFTTLIQADVPDVLRGRVMALWSVAFLGTRPVSALTTGWVTDTLGVRPAMSLSAAVILAGAWATRGPRLEARDVAATTTPDELAPDLGEGT